MVGGEKTPTNSCLEFPTEANRLEKERQRQRRGAVEAERFTFLFFVAAESFPKKKHQITIINSVYECLITRISMKKYPFSWDNYSLMMYMIPLMDIEKHYNTLHNTTDVTMNHRFWMIPSGKLT